MRHLLLTTAIIASLIGPKFQAEAADTTPTGNPSVSREDTPADLRIREMLNATVKIEAMGGTGSGEIIHSGPDGVYIITNHHVVAHEMDAVVALAMKAHQKLPIVVRIRNWLVLEHNQPAIPVSVTAKLVADDEAHDLALFKVTDKEWRAPFTAHAIDEKDRVIQTEEAYVAGSPLGFRSMLTEGLVSLTSVESSDPTQDGSILVSAPTINGNSGGGAFVQRNGHYVMIGIPEAIATNHEDKTLVEVPHMALVIPMATVRAFLDKIDMSDLLKNTTAAASE